MLTNGWVKVQFDGHIWEELATFVDDWVASESVRRYIQDYSENPPDKATDDLQKRFIARLLPHDREIVTLKADDKFLAFATQPDLISFISTCMGGHQPTLQYYDLWHTWPLADGRERRGSQEWHKDAEAFDKPGRVVKVFLYFSDCLSEGAGPFEMMTPEGRITFLMKRGDGMIADTGYYTHRGGYSTTDPRTYAVWVFNDSERILAKPRYNLTDEARESFASPVLFEYRDWEAKRKAMV